MVSLLDFFLGGSWKHLTDEQLLALTDGELTRFQSRQAQRHLESCWNCRARQARLQSVIHGFVDYSNEVITPLMPPSPSGRDRFLALLDKELAARSMKWQLNPLPLLRRMYERSMNPVFVTVAVLLGAAVILTAVWRDAAKPALHPEDFLAKAAFSDQMALHQTGVAYQRVEIRTQERVIVRSIYQDLTRHRIAAHSDVGHDDTSLKRRLESVGVSWQKPLSVSDYQRWRSQVRVLNEGIRRSGPGEWTLTTETDDSNVRRASLTVREADFHPIAREVVFRNFQTVEIAELNFDVLPWSAINESIFGPEHPDATIQGGIGTHLSLRAALPTPAQLEGAELKALFALAKVHADAGEDIHVESGHDVVHVRGLVDSDSRKQEIERELHSIAFVKPELQSVEEIERRRQVAASGGPLQVHPEEVGSSPLQTLAASNGISAEQQATLSRTLVQSSLAISRQAQMLSMLGTRYGNSDRDLTPDNLRLLNALKNEHISVLLQALTGEEAALSPYASPGDFQGASVPGGLSELANTNQQLCVELVSAVGEKNRPATEILHDLVRVASRIRRFVNTIQVHPQQ